MRVVWSILLGLIVTCPHINFCNKNKRSTSSLCNKVDAILKEIDVVYQSHDHGGGHGTPATTQSATDAHAGHDTKQIAPVAESMAKSETPAAPVVSPEKQVAPVIQQSVQESKKEAPRNGASDIDKAKQQIKMAEIEIAKLKELVKAAEATPLISDIKKIMELNKDLIKVFEKQIQDYRAHGLPYSDPKIQRAQKNISIAEQELLQYQKQLKEQKIAAFKVVGSQVSESNDIVAPATTNQPLPKSKEEKKEQIQTTRISTKKEEPVHAHDGPISTVTKNGIVSVAVEHAHETQTQKKDDQTPTSKQSVEKKEQPDKAKQEVSHAHGSPTVAPLVAPAHGHGQPAASGNTGAADDKTNMPPLFRVGTNEPVINAFTPELNKPATHDAGGHGAHGSGAGVEQSEAYKNAHAFHATGLAASDFKFSPFGFVQSELSYSTRQMLALQEHQVYLVPAQAAFDREEHDVEDRSQFFTSLHVHTGVLVTGPEIKAIKAKPTADISFEYYGPLPLNYAPLASPAFNVPQVTPSFDAKIGGEFLVHGTLYLEWERTMLLFGQTWHPGADPIVSVADSRVTFFGQLADPLNRFFQVRVTQKAGKNFEFIAALCQYIDNKAKFNLGVEVEQTNNPGWFNFHFQGRALVGKNVFALAADIYTEQPRLFENAKLVLDRDLVSLGIDDVFPPSETGACLTAPVIDASSTSGFQDACGITATKIAVSSFSMMGFAKIDRDPFIAKAKLLVGSNLGHPFGGFAILNDCTAPDPVNDTGIRVYGPLRMATLALDFCIKSKFEPGLYLGFTKNLGSSQQVWKFQDTSPSHIPCTQEQIETDDVTNCLTVQERLSLSIFRYFQDLDYTVVIAPRLKWNLAPITFSAEIEYTKAGYGEITKFGSVTCVSPIECTRFLLEAYFNF